VAVFCTKAGQRGQIAINDATKNASGRVPRTFVPLRSAKHVFLFLFPNAPTERLSPVGVSAIGDDPLLSSSAWALTVYATFVGRVVVSASPRFSSFPIQSAVRKLTRVAGFNAIS
jgi:hypothetical protein